MHSRCVLSSYNIHCWRRTIPHYLDFSAIRKMTNASDSVLEVIFLSSGNSAATPEIPCVLKVETPRDSHAAAALLPCDPMTVARQRQPERPTRDVDHCEQEAGGRDLQVGLLPLGSDLAPQDGPP